MRIMFCQKTHITWTKVVFQSEQFKRHKLSSIHEYGHNCKLIWGIRNGYLWSNAFVQMDQPCRLWLSSKDNHYQVTGFQLMFMMIGGLHVIQEVGRAIFTV